MPMRVLDLSHHNARKLASGVYVVTANITLAVESGASGFITRSNYGTRVDTTAREHNARITATGAPRAFYWYDLSRQDPRRQAETAFAEAGAVRGRRGYCDLEENRRADGADPAFPPYSEDYFDHVNTGLLRCDELAGVITGIYSRGTFLDAYFTLEQQLRWAAAGRPGWWAHWTEPGPGVPWVPAGWKTQRVKWVLWQDRQGPWPGFEGNVDQSRVSTWVMDLSEIFGGATEPVPAPAAPLDRIDGAVSEIRSIL